MTRIAGSIELQASAAQTASAESTPVTGIRGWRGGLFELDVTAAATEVDDTLNVYVQRLLPSGDWDDLVAFTQVLGNGGAVRFVADVIFDSQASDERAARDQTLAAGTVSAVGLTDSLRVAWNIVDPGGAAASFTFNVTAEMFD